MSYSLKNDVDQALFAVHMVIEAAAACHLREMQRRFIPFRVRLPEHVLGDVSIRVTQAGGTVCFEATRCRFANSVFELHLRQQTYSLSISSPRWRHVQFIVNPAVDNYLDLSGLPA